MKTVLRFAVLIALLAASVAVATPDVAHAQPTGGDPVYICDFIDEFDGIYMTMSLGPTLGFRAGERLVITAVVPDVVPSSPLLQPPGTFIYLEVAGVEVDTDGVPGTLSYTFNSDTLLETGFPVLEWGVDSGVADTFDPQLLFPLEWDAECTTASTETTTVPVPGCDVQINIPATSVVGTFLADTALHYAPGKLIVPQQVLEAGQSLWVLGVDATGGYYKVLLACGTYWVPVSSMGPTYDDVWNGTPLPTNVVD